MENHYVATEEPAELPEKFAELKRAEQDMGPLPQTGKNGESPLVDQCWSVPLLMAAAAFLVAMPWAWFGLLLVLFMETFGVTREEAYWPKSVGSMLTFLSGLAVHFLQRRIRTYYVVLLSTVFVSAGFILSAFAPSILWMTLSFGVMHGFGHGAFLTSAVIYTLQHFDKYRTVATSFIFIAFALSAIVSQFVLACLVDTYALKGALLIYGGVLLNSTAIVMLAKRPAPITMCTRTANEHCLRNAAPGATSYDATLDVQSNHRTKPKPSQANDNSQQDSSSLVHVLQLFRTPAFYVLLGAIVVGDYTLVEFSTTIVDYGTDKGMSLGTAKHLMTFTSAGQLAGRVVVPLIADLLAGSRRPLYSLCFLVLCASMMAMPYVTSFPGMFTLATTVGVSHGYILCIRYVLLAEYLGVERTAASSGMVGVVMVPVSLLSPMIVGKFRDSGGSYDGYYRMLGAMSLAAALLFATLDICARGTTRCTKNGPDQLRKQLTDEL